MVGIIAWQQVLSLRLSKPVGFKSDKCKPFAVFWLTITGIFEAHALERLSEKTLDLILKNDIFEFKFHVLKFNF